MERKIGEIFEFKKDWYQCVEGRCKDCHFSEKRFLCKQFITKDFCTHGIIFKKLEKVGEPYSIGTHIFQRYKVFIKPYIFNDPFFTVNTAIDDEFISIEIKQNEEVMEEKKIQHYDCFFDREPYKSNLKPFSIEAAKAGKPVCTRDERKARIICFDAKRNKPIIALVTMDNGKEYIETYHLNGRFNDDDKTESGGDLMMLPEKKEGWVNIYKMKESTFGYITAYFDTEEKAKEDKEQLTGYVATIKINWEE